MAKLNRTSLLRYAALLLVVSPLPACGSTIYAFKANDANEKLEEARQLGAEKLAPYEYFKAELHLKKARTEAAEADYGAAMSLADTSKQLSIQAIKQSREARRGASE